MTSTSKHYQDWVNLNCRSYTDENYCIVALNGEAGEVAEWHKKHTLRGNPSGKLTRQDLLSELGDVMFYLTKLALLNGWSLEKVMDYNIEKIEKRVADGKKSIA